MLIAIGRSLMIVFVTIVIVGSATPTLTRSPVFKQ